MGECGPLNIYDPHYYLTLVKFLGNRAAALCPVTLRRYKSAKTRFPEYNLLNLVHRVIGHKKKNTVKNKIH